ncbi:MAG: fused signal recognition particle receptor, partial [Cryptosporangiaceae bacterium]|nr:fused signal recognition particle receptor [Cryptosporangiaceae bacterium]
MESAQIYLVTAIVIVVLAVVAGAGYVLTGRRSRELDEPRRDEAPSGTTAVEPPLVEAQAPAEVSVAEPQVERPEPSAGRLVRLRSRLSRSQNSLGKGLLSLLARDKLDADAWEEIEDTLLTADVGIGATTEITERLRE